MLYLFSSPIGNLDDFTYRAVITLPDLDYLLCEDTRKTRILVDHFFSPEIKIKMLAFNEINEKEKLPKVIDFLEMGLNIGLISNAGTPTISDPGYKLVRECRKRKITVVPIPGPTAIIAALSISGLPTDKFLFIGYLPKNSNQLNKLLLSIKDSNFPLGTIIAYESPYRLLKSLCTLKEIFGDINIVIAREITKVYETFYSGKISDVSIEISKTLKGEITLLFNLYENNR